MHHFQIYIFIFPLLIQYTINTICVGHFKSPRILYYHLKK